jgi:hypothetical protein
MKKALQTGQLRALGILPEREAGFCFRDAGCGRICDDFAEVLIVDLRGELLGMCAVPRRRLRDRPGDRAGAVGGRLGKRSNCEAQLPRSDPPERVEDSLLELRELERPRRRARVDVQ